MANSAAAKLAARRSTAMATPNGAVLVPVGADEVLVVTTDERQRAGVVEIGVNRAGAAAVHLGVKMGRYRVPASQGPT